MKKILSWILLVMMTVTIIGGTISNTKAYELSQEKQSLIENNLNEDIVSAIERIVNKWDDQKQFTVYNKMGKVIFNIQMNILKDTNKTEERKKELLDKYNAFLYVIEGQLSDNFKPMNNTGDSI